MLMKTTAEELAMRTFFQTFNLALGMLVALIIAAIGAGLLYLAISLGDMVWVGAIGAFLLLGAAAMLYMRVTFLGILDFFSGGSWS